MDGYGYDLVDVSTLRDPVTLLEDWWDRSYGLRFISSVRTNHDDPNAGFKDLIPQFAD